MNLFLHHKGTHQLYTTFCCSITISIRSAVVYRNHFVTAFSTIRILVILLLPFLDADDRKIVSTITYSPIYRLCK